VARTDSGEVEAAKPVPRTGSRGFEAGSASGGDWFRGLLNTYEKAVAVP